ncbi:MAG: MotA/TolQ/ExbB proton channel family protein [Kiritimatiellae bacterium]|nr:MotA/TolQ/ExbB proton channel family protein [Kiritimatiellia bacterium]
MTNISFFIENGGPILWIIIVMGIIGAFVYLERALYLHRSRIDVDDFLQGIFNSMSRGNVAEAKLLCEETVGPVARLTLMAITTLSRSPESIENTLKDVAAGEIARMERRLSVVSLIAHVTPMLGILGTIIGILKSLIAMQAEAPMVQTGDITPGLIYGCITTIAGLVVAIPCYIGFQLLVLKIDRLVLDIRYCVTELINFQCKFQNESPAFLAEQKEEEIDASAKTHDAEETGEK